MDSYFYGIHGTHGRRGGRGGFGWAGFAPGSGDQGQGGIVAHALAQAGAPQFAAIGERGQFALNLGLQLGQQQGAVVPEHTAANADALQIERDDQVVEGAPHHPAKLVDQGVRCAVAGLACCEQSRSAGVAQCLKAAGNRIARDQALDIAQVAAAAQGVLVVADKAVAGVAGVAVLPLSTWPSTHRPRPMPVLQVT